MSLYESKASYDRAMALKAMEIARSKADLLAEYITEADKLSMVAPNWGLNVTSTGDKYKTDAERNMYNKLAKTTRDMRKRIVGDSKLSFPLILSKYKMLVSDEANFNATYDELKAKVAKDIENAGELVAADVQPRTIGKVPPVGTKFVSSKNPSYTYEITYINNGRISFRILGKNKSFDVPIGEFQNARKSGKITILTTESLTEATRNELVSKARSQDRKRYNNRLSYRPVTFEGVNIREFFINDDLVFTTRVGDYTCILAVRGALSDLKSFIHDKNKCTYVDVLKSINSSLARDGVRLDCSCPDWLYGGYKYMATQGGYNYGTPENRPPKRRNPLERGSMCKHLAALLSNKVWVVKVAAAINNYIRMHVKECAPYLYDDPDAAIAPKGVVQLDDTQINPHDTTTNTDDTMSDETEVNTDDLSRSNEVPSEETGDAVNNVDKAPEDEIEPSDDEEQRGVRSDK